MLVKLIVLNFYLQCGLCDQQVPLGGDEHGGLGLGGHEGPVLQPVQLGRRSPGGRQTAHGGLPV